MERKLWRTERSKREWKNVHMSLPQVSIQQGISNMSLPQVSIQQGISNMSLSQVSIQQVI